MFYCKRCGQLLQVSEEEHESGLFITPCENCLSAEYDEGYEEGRALCSEE